MPTALWPLGDLRLLAGDLVLAPPDDAEQAQLASMVPDDLELDPAAPRTEGLPEHESRVLVMRQTFWRHLGGWSSTSWALHFAVRAGDRLIGEQVLEGENFPSLHTVDSYSWLLPDVRGRGLGTSMRGAVLALAFGPLGADSAISSAWHDNHASLGVSGALGYQPDGEHEQLRGDGVDTMIHLRLSRSAWLASGRGDGVAIENFAACAPMFGLG